MNQVTTAETRLCKHGCGTKLYPVYRADDRLHWTQGDGHTHDAIECVAAARATIARLTAERDASDERRDNALREEVRHREMLRKAHEHVAVVDQRAGELLDKAKRLRGVRWEVRYEWFGQTAGETVKRWHPRRRLGADDRGNAMTLRRSFRGNVAYFRDVRVVKITTYAKAKP